MNAETTSQWLQWPRPFESTGFCRKGPKLFALALMGLATALSALAAPRLEAATATIPASADSTLRRQQANQNRGSDETLRIGWSQGSRAVVRFPQTAIIAALGGGQLTAARLELNLDESGEDFRNPKVAALYRLTRDWTESGVTWNCPIDTAPANNSANCATLWNGGATAASATATQTISKNQRGTVSFDVTADVAAFLAGTSNFGWLLRWADESKSGRTDFVSREGEEDEDEEGDLTSLERDNGGIQGEDDDDDDEKFAPRLILTYTTGGGGDTTAPTLAITAPAAIVINRDSAFRVAVELTYSDAGSGVAPSTLLVAIDGSALTCTTSPTGASCTAPALANGSHAITAEVRDVAGNRATAASSFALAIDPTPPLVRFVLPLEGSFLSPMMIASMELDALLVGEVDDVDTGIVAGSVRLLIDGVDRTAEAVRVDRTISFSAARPLADGAHTAQLSATDGAGNVATAVLHFTTDGHMPLISILRPTDLSFQDPAPFDVAIAFSDGESGLNLTTLHIFVDGEDKTSVCTVTATGATCPAASFGAGPHAITASIEDRAANLGLAERTFAVAIDTESPTLAITAPAGLVEGVMRPTIQLTYTDAGSGIAPASLRVAVDGIDISASCSTTSSAASCTAPVLTRGNHTVAASIADARGNSTSATSQFAATFPVAIAFEAPLDNAVLGVPVVRVEGSVSPDAVQVEVNGVAAAVSGGRFMIPALGLHDGVNNLIAVATDGGGNVGSAALQVTADTVAPYVSITAPTSFQEGVLTTPTVTVTGWVNDLAIGTINDSDVRVEVGGIAATVENRSYRAEGVPVPLGRSTIEAVALDRAGNRATALVEVERLDRTGSPRIEIAAGDAQTGTILSPLAAPLVVRALDAAGLPQGGVTVVFRVVQGDGTVAGGRTASAVTGPDGRASVLWTLGRRAGSGVNRVRATAVGIVGEVRFEARANPDAPFQVHVASGDHQRGLVGEALALPLVAVVFDRGDNPLEGVSVRFRSALGDGRFTSGPEFAVATDGNGLARTRFELGTEAGLDNHWIEARVDGVDIPAMFKASSFVPGDPAATAIVGVVLDGQGDPIPGVTIQIKDRPLRTTTDSTGQFRLTGVPTGRAFLIAEGSTATRTGSWPNLEFELFVLPGVENTLERPVFLLPLDLARSSAPVDETRGATITLPDVPGFSLEVQPGSVTFPGGGRSGVVSATAVHADKIPMAPGGGMQPRLIVTIQPAGAIFDPPARLTLPNVDGFAPGTVTEMFSFDHDLGAFVSIGVGEVSDDGTVIRSAPGFGVVKAGWHCGSPPGGSGQAAPLTISFPEKEPILLLAPPMGRPKTLTASGGPPLDAEWTWEVDSSSIASVTPSGSGLCPNQGSCSTQISGVAPGETMVTARITCRTTGNTKFEKKKVIVIKGEIKEVYSEQLAGQECNMLPPKTSPSENSPMIMGTVSGNTAKISAKVMVMPTSAAQYARIGVRQVGSTNILGDEKADANGGKPIVMFDASPAGDGSGGKLYEVVFGVDVNDDGKLQNDEVQSTFQQGQIRVVTPGDLAVARSTADTRVGQFVLFPISKAFLEYFLGTASSVPGATAGTTSITNTAPGLSHPTGANWSGSGGMCTANITSFNFGPSSDGAKAVAATSYVENLIKNELNNHKAQVQAFFAAPTSPATATFGPWAWSGSIAFGDWKVSNPDLALSWGSISITGMITSVTVRKSDLQVTSVTYDGSFSDLYDFSYFGAVVLGIQACRPQAILQAGFPGPSGGRIFISSVNFQRTATPGLIFGGFDYSFR